jgi:hypothetical protein
MVSMIFSNPDLGEAISSCKICFIGNMDVSIDTQITMNRIVKALDSM